MWHLPCDCCGSNFYTDLNPRVVRPYCNGCILEGRVVRRVVEPDARGSVFLEGEVAGVDLMNQLLKDRVEIFKEEESARLRSLGVLPDGKGGKEPIQLGGEWIPPEKANPLQDIREANEKMGLEAIRLEKERKEKEGSRYYPRRVV